MTVQEERTCGSFLYVCTSFGKAGSVGKLYTLAAILTAIAGIAFPVSRSLGHLKHYLNWFAQFNYTTLFCNKASAPQLL